MIDNIKESTNFDNSWTLMLKKQFPVLSTFGGVLMTIFPGTASVESDFSIVNCEKDNRRFLLTNFTLEGILHSKQYELLADITSSLGGRTGR